MSTMEFFNNYMKQAMVGVDCHIEKDGPLGFELVKDNGEKLNDSEIMLISKKLFKQSKGSISTEVEFNKFTDSLKTRAHLGGSLLSIIDKTKSIYHKLQPMSTDMTSAVSESLKRGETSSFGAAKPLSRSSLIAPLGVTDPSPFPTSSLTRLLTGDVKPEWITGLGRMQPLPKKHPRPNIKDGVKPGARPLRPSPGYKDVFVSTLDEYTKKGCTFTPTDKDHLTTKNDLDKLAGALALDDADVAKVKASGAWMILIHPGSRLAVPTKREFPKYKEGGFTESEQQEWVTPNVDILKEMRSGAVRLYKIEPNGDTTEWRVFKGKLYSFDDWTKAIDEAVKKKP